MEIFLSLHLVLGSEAALQPPGCCAELCAPLPEAAVPSRVLASGRGLSPTFPELSGHVSLLKVPEFTGEALSQDDNPAGQSGFQCLRLLLWLCFLFTSGSWYFLSFLLQSAACICYVLFGIFLSLELWDGGGSKVYVNSVCHATKIPGNKLCEKVKQ